MPDVTLIRLIRPANLLKLRVFVGQVRCSRRIRHINHDAGRVVQGVHAASSDAAFSIPVPLAELTLT